MLGFPRWHINPCRTQTHMLFLLLCEEAYTKHKPKHSVMLHEHECDTWLRLSSNYSGVRVPQAAGKANKKGEMSAVHCRFWLKDYILTSKKGSHYCQMRDEGKKNLSLFTASTGVTTQVTHSRRTQLWFHICQQNNCSARAEMSQCWAVRKRKLVHIWRKSGNDSVCKWMRWWNTTGPLWTQRACKHFHAKWKQFSPKLGFI